MYKGDSGGEEFISFPEEEMITFLNETNWLSVPSCSVYLDFVRLVADSSTDFEQSSARFLSLFSVPDTRTETDTRIHTVCQSCSFSASHNILYKSYINASSTAFLNWCTSPPHLSKETLHESNTFTYFLFLLHDPYMNLHITKDSRCPFQKLPVLGEPKEKKNVYSYRDACIDVLLHQSRQTFDQKCCMYTQQACSVWTIGIPLSPFLRNKVTSCAETLKRESFPPVTYHMLHLSQATGLCSAIRNKCIVF